MTGGPSAIAAAVIGAVLAMPAAAQEQRIVTGTGAVLRGLDKMAGEATDIVLAAGESAVFGRLTVTLSECRYPAGEPDSEAFALLGIREEGTDAPIFSGWMIASSPALNPLDHSRFDIWVLRCTTS